MKNQYFSELSDAAATFLTMANYQDEDPIIAEQLEARRVRDKQRDASVISKCREENCESVVIEEYAGVECLTITPKNSNSDHADKVLLYFYGGGYIVGSPEEDLVVSAVLAQKLGVRVVSPRYSLAPEYPFPTAHDQCFTVYRHLVDTVGAENIWIAGESAGGNMSVAVLLHAYQDGLPMPSACALLSPWVDLSCDANDPAKVFPHDPTLTPQYIDVASKLYADGENPVNPFISPLHGEFGDWFPPVILTTGTGDCLVHMTRRLAEKFDAAGVNVSLNVWDMLWHVFEFYPDVPEADLSLGHIADFLTENG